MLIPSYTAQQTIYEFGFVFTPLLYSVTVLANGQATLNIPNSSSRFKAIMKISGNSEMWVALNRTAYPPTGNTFAITTSELINQNNLCREVKGGDVLHFSCSTNTDLSIALYALLNPN